MGRSEACHHLLVPSQVCAAPLRVSGNPRSSCPMAALLEASAPLLLPPCVLRLPCFSLGAMIRVAPPQACRCARR